MVPERSLVVALGDSLTAGHVARAGAWYPRYAPYTDHLAARLGPRVRFANAGVDGDLTVGMQRRLRSDVIDLGPDLVILLGGANDLGWGRSPARVAATIEAIADGVADAGADLVLCAVPPLMGYPEGTAQRHDLNARLRALAARRGAGFADLFAPLARDGGELDPRWSSDGLHLNADGYARFADVLEPVIEARLAALDRLAAPGRSDRAGDP